MIAELNDGTLIPCEDSPMGGGASGTTYYSLDKNYVVKIFKNPPKTLPKVLSEIVGTYNCVKNDPYWGHFMSWPDGIVIRPSLGVRMPRAPRGMEKMSWVILPKAYNALPPEKKRWDKRLLAAWRLAAAVGRMHRSGVAHSDLSPNNIMIDATAGTINLIDLDGLVIPGFVPPQVLGTPEYIAPEVLEGRALPSVSTDRHALAVLLYQLLLFKHPLRGPRVYSQDAETDERLALGHGAVYIDHPSDTSNRPKQGFWSAGLLGTALETLFMRAFVDGIKDPSTRPTAGEWQTALSRLFDRIIPCPNSACEDRFFPLNEKLLLACPWCGTKLPAGKQYPILRLFRGDGTGRFEPEPDGWIAGYNEKPIYLGNVKRGIEFIPDADIAPLALIVQRKDKWFIINRGLTDARIVDNGTLGRRIERNGEIELYEGLALMMDALPKGRLAYVQWMR